MTSVRSVLATYAERLGRLDTELRIDIVDATSEMVADISFEWNDGQELVNHTAESPGVDTSESSKRELTYDSNGLIDRLEKPSASIPPSVALGACRLMSWCSLR